MYLDNLKTLREAVGISINELAKVSQVDRTTIWRIEKHYSIKKITLVSVIEALNSLAYNKKNRPLDAEQLITDTSKFGRGLDIDTLQLSNC